MSPLTSKRIELDGLQGVQEHFLGLGWTDGLPIIPPTLELVEDALRCTRRPPEAVLGRIPERRRSITVEKVAINAVMAGCRPEYMPVLVAAVEAMCDPASGPHGPTASTAGAGLLVIVNGPPVSRLRINSGGNVFGPGVRANATIGRAMRLVIMNCAGALPGRVDRSTLGHPGKYSWCIGEDEFDGRWNPLHAERGFAKDQGAVTTFWGLSPIQVSDHESGSPEGIVASIGRAMGVTGVPRKAGLQIVVVVSGEHRETIAEAGWSKSDVREFLLQNAPAGIVSAAEDFLLVAAGGSGGRFSAFSVSWGLKSGHAAVTKAVEACVQCPPERVAE